MSEYKEAYKDERYLDCNQLLISLSMGSFHKYNNEGLIVSFSIGNKKIMKKQYVIKLKYEPDIGLTDEALFV